MGPDSGVVGFSQFFLGSGPGFQRRMRFYARFVRQAHIRARYLRRSSAFFRAAKMPSHQPRKFVVREITRNFLPHTDAADSPHVLWV